MTQVPVSLVLHIGADGRAPASEFHRLPRYGLYVILHGQRVLRIGESSSGENRLRKGFREPLRRTIRGKERKNYIAYAWRNEYRNEKLRVDYFGLPEERFRESHFRRALEAEVTFQFRLAYNKWPSRMNEIHFEEAHRTDSLIVGAAEGVLHHYRVPYCETIGAIVRPITAQNAS